MNTKWFLFFVIASCFLASGSALAHQGDACAQYWNDGCAQFDATVSREARAYRGQLVCVRYEYEGPIRNPAPDDKLEFVGVPSSFEWHVSNEERRRQLAAYPFRRAKRIAMSGTFCIRPEDVAAFGLVGGVICDKYHVMGFIGPNDFHRGMQTGMVPFVIHVGTGAKNPDHHPR